MIKYVQIHRRMLDNNNRENGTNGETVSRKEDWIGIVGDSSNKSAFLSSVSHDCGINPGPFQEENHPIIASHKD